MQETLLFLGTEYDTTFLPRLKILVGTATVFVSLNPIQTIAEVILYCKKRNITGIITTNTTLLAKLLYREGNRKQPSLDAYAGSYFKRDGIEIVFINPLEQLVSVPYGSFLAHRFISKLTEPASWPRASEFTWELLEPSNIEAIFNSYQEATIIAVDIETTKINLAITSISYTALFIDSTVEAGFRTHTSVLKLDSMWALTWMRKFNWELEAPKCFQNGKYDNAYLARYNAPIYNWLLDTATFQHCWYSELPKDLAILGAYFIKEVVYWKELAESSDPKERLRYNGLDTWATANVIAQQLLQAPKYAKTNFLQEFPVNFPCHLAEMTGIKRDLKRLKISRESFKEKVAKENSSLSKMLGVDNFNVASYKQVGALLKILGCEDLPSTSEIYLKKAILRHPLNARILNKVLDIRGYRKLVSTYLTEGKELNGRILYALNPHSTDTGRLASREHHFWCGLQIQNIPRGKDVKQTLRADDGFFLGEADLEQAESRDTAYIAGDENLIAAVGGERDFHSVNASSFFGCGYESIYDDKTNHTKNKPLRDLAKRVNHGANYNMGAEVLVDTMGEDNVREAGRILNLPKMWTLKQIAAHLLGVFHKTYPTISKVYYPGVISEIVTTHRLTSKATHNVTYQATPAGWVRYCFGHPERNKLDLNAYVAHAPQSLNAMTLNKAFVRVFYDIAMNPKYSDNFKLLAQIHDSILFLFREGHEYLADMVKEYMEIPVKVTGYDGKTREFIVPSATKIGLNGKFARYWDETE